MTLTPQQNTVPQAALQTGFSGFKKHQNCLRRWLTMGIARPSSNILIQKVGVGPWEERKTSSHLSPPQLVQGHVLETLI